MENAEKHSVRVSMLQKNFPKANRSSASVKHDNTESMKETILGRLLDSRL